MELSTVFWIGGIAVGSIAAAAYVKGKGNPRKAFSSNYSRFKPLVDKLPVEFSMEDWSVKIVDVNNQSLTKWWMALVKQNGNDGIKIKTELISTLNQWGYKISKVEPTKPCSQPINKRLAKEAFIANLNEFAPLLNTLVGDVFDIKMWTEQIINVNDYHLTELWKKYTTVADIQEKWRRLLASWQIKGDSCRTFTCVNDDNIASYILPNGDAIKMGVKYKVETPCWVYTSEDESGLVNKKVICKGVVIPVESK